MGTPLKPDRYTTTNGKPPHPEFNTADSPAPQPIDPVTGQHEAYWVLTEEERAKGFVRPVRRTYRHVGIPGPKYPLRDVVDTEHGAHPNGYVKYEEYPKGDAIVGRYWTQAQLDRIGIACGALTTMGVAIAETYARDPHIYGATFCCECRSHFPVGEQGEFVWSDDETQRVGT